MTFNCFDDNIPNQFIISKIYKDYINKTNLIIIKLLFSYFLFNISP